MANANNISTIFNENRGSCYRKISDAPWWSHLDFDSEQDEDLMFIDIWCSVVSNEHFKVYRIIDAAAIDDNYPDKERIQKEFKEPGPDFVHPSIFVRGRILNDFEALAIKYGVDTFENYIKDLYNNYPLTPENKTTIEFVIENNKKQNIFLLNHKWKLIAELLSSIHNYFDNKGISL